MNASVGAVENAADVAAQKPLVLLLPGLLCDDAVWVQQCAALDVAQCIVPSYGVAHSITAMAELALSMVPEGQTFSVAGHSMGGRVALELARMVPDRIERLALLDTGTAPMAQGAAAEQEIQGRQALLAKARAEGMRAMGAVWARGMVHPSRLEDPVFDDILAMIERKTTDEFAAQLQALMQRPDARDVLAQLQCPTLLLCGRQDIWSPLQRHEDMHQQCPPSWLCVIEDSGHMSTMEQPQAVSAALQDWMTRR